MTREEAIDILFGVIAANSEEENEALDMAIEALQAKTDGDLISRQDAIDALGEEPPVWYDGDDEIAERNQWRRDKAAIESLPSAEPKTGEWVMLERVENVHDIYGVPTWGVNYMCDKCGFITTAIQDHFSQYKFCPNCGARMKGGEDE